jgi:hypothetical protein
VTKGVVSRIDRSTYSHGRTTLLAIQVDAAINSGNSGGPVLLQDRVVRGAACVRAAPLLRRRLSRVDGAPPPWVLVQHTRVLRCQRASAATSTAERALLPPRA